MANGYKKILLLTIVLRFSCYTAISQYYYKDLVTTQQTNENFQVYKANRINHVKLNSFQGSSPVTEGFVCEQTVNLNQNKVVTYTKTADIGESFFTAFYNPQGLLIKTIDSTEESAGLSIYQYDANNRLIQLRHETHAADNSSSTTESHYWEYTDDGNPKKMFRIKNTVDSTIIEFTIDEKGNVIQEEAFRKKISQGKIYYYYDDKNRLTDVVKYNVKARRLLPDYIFEYEENGELSTMTIVPEGSNDYQKWYYKFDETGLKLVEFCYNKKMNCLEK